MNKRSSYIRSACLLMIVALAAAVISAQKERPVAGKGLNAVNVKLARYGGAQFGGGGMSSFRTTNDKGEFDFGVVPAGSYHLTISLAEEPVGQSNTDATGAKQKHEMNKSIIQNIRAREANPSADPKECLITINGAVGGPIKRGWNFGTAKAFEPTSNSNAKAAAIPAWSGETIDIVSDGHQPLKGTVVQSRSDVRND